MTNKSHHFAFPSRYLPIKQISPHISTYFSAYFVTILRMSQCISRHVSTFYAHTLYHLPPNPSHLPSYFILSSRTFTNVPLNTPQYLISPFLTTTISLFLFPFQISTTSFTTSFLLLSPFLQDPSRPSFPSDLLAFSLAIAFKSRSILRCAACAFRIEFGGIARVRNHIGRSNSLVSGM